MIEIESEYNISDDMIKSLFGSDRHALRMHAEFIPHASLLWSLRPLAIGSIQEPDSPTAKLSDESILREFAFRLSNTGKFSEYFLVDRYGGGSIGANGGSGRAGYIGRGHLKGIGPTPLIGDGEKSHSSGGAYLEEAMRETIFSETFELENTNSVIRNICIIDTGEWQKWPRSAKIKKERKVIIVRPRFLRLGHFDRALGYRPRNQALEAGNDALRVRTFADYFANWCNQEFRSLGDLLIKSIEKTLDSLAFSHVFCFRHNALSSSNISLGGRLLDFGAASTFPYWGTARTPTDVHSPRIDFWDFMQIVDDLVIALMHHNPEVKQDLRPLMLHASNFSKSYEDRVYVWILRRAGLTDEQIYELDAQNDQSAKLLTLQWFTDSHNKTYSFNYDRSCSRHPTFEIGCVWRSDDHRAKQVLTFIEKAFKREDFDLIRARARIFTAPRQAFHREYMRRFLHRLIGTVGELPISNTAVSDWISELIVRNRRFSAWIPRDCVPVGFFHSSCLAMAICARSGSNKLIAIVENCLASAAGIEVKAGMQFELTNISNNSVSFSNKEMTPTTVYGRMKWCFRGAPQ
ncbi:protein adenylyltransferase SelO family protein [Aquidulcibacter sp.]|uniref:protein adenylyltransferase SelO family protein n=1 Tax=Aquidulcibacter sp. TaxID=2052990 RepID=UPI0028B189E7|nr:protein adenylyltransferase SelO family protein [Aquidulcibacter sp.]